LLPGVKTRHPLVTLLLRWGINALGVLLAARLIKGIDYDDGTSLVIVVVVLGLFNAFLKPVLVFLALPFVVLTLGLGILFINALLFLVAGRLVEGFHVASFPHAFFGALIVSVVNLLLGRLVGDIGLPPRPPRSPPSRGGRSGGGDVIDV
jgi:putative membrane protein